MEFIINLKDLVSPVVQKTTERVKDFRKASKDAGLELAKLGGAVGLGLVKSFGIAGVALGKAVVVMGRATGKGLADAAKEAAPHFEKMGKYVWGKAAGAAEQIGDWAGARVAGAAKKIGDWAAPHFEKAGKFLSEKIGEPIAGVAQKIGARIAGAAKQIGDKASPYFEKAGKFLSEKIGAPVAGIGKKIGEGVAGAWKKVAGPVSGVIQKLAAPFAGIAGKLAAPFAGVGTAIGGVLDKLGLKGKASAAGKALFSMAKTGVLFAAAAVGALAKASIGAAVGVVAFGLKAALAFRGMGQFQAQLGRFQQNLKGLFRGVDTTPLIRSMQRAADFFDRNRASGKMMSEILTSGMNLVSRAIEALVPIGEEFVWGLIAGFHLVRGAAYSVAATLLSLAGPAIKWGLNLAKGINVAKGAAYAGIGIFIAVAGVLMLMAASTLLTALPFIVLGAALIYIGAKLYKLLDVCGLAKPVLWGVAIVAALMAAPFILVAVVIGALAYATGWLIDQIIAGVEAFKKWVGIGGEVQTATDGIGNAVNGLMTKLPGGDKASESGKLIGDGLVQGLLGKIPDVQAAGKALANAADQGVKSGAEIHSPAKKFIRNAGQMGAGTVKGLEASGPMVQAAAEENLVPNVPSPFGSPGGEAAAGPEKGSPPAGAGAAMIHIENLTIGGKTAEPDMKRIHEEWLGEVAAQMGLRR